MIVRAIDSNGDWTFGKGRNNYLSKIPAVAQSIQTRLSSFLGDCFFSTNSGIDWFNLLGSTNKTALNLAISSTILNTQGVIKLVQLSINLNAATRKLTITYSVIVANADSVPQLVELSTKLILTEDGDVLTDESGDPLETEN